jgi:hypothetical protein
MNLLNPPEIPDGGYWSAHLTTVVEGGIVPDSPQLQLLSWSAWPGEAENSEYMVVRTLVPVFGVTDKSVADIFPVDKKPLGRVEGS